MVIGEVPGGIYPINLLYLLCLAVDVGFQDFGFMGFDIAVEKSLGGSSLEVLGDSVDFMKGGFCLGPILKFRTQINL